MFTIKSSSEDFPTRTGKRFKVVINQGGGIFGYIITNFMSYLDFDLYSKIDLAAGTSIGGILSMTYSVDADYKYVNKLFKLAGPKIFGKKKSLLLNSCKYDSGNLKKFLKEIFKDKTLADLKRHVLIMTTDFTLALPRIFENINMTPEEDISLVDIGLMTSAAPTFFEARKFSWKRDKKISNLMDKLYVLSEFQKDKTMKDPATKSTSVIMDGGLLENIPIISTYSALHTEYGALPGDIDVFVIGAGDLEKEKNHTIDEVKKWSVMETLNNLILPYVTDSNEMTSLFWGLQLGFNSFTYYNPIKIKGAMDDVSSMPSIERQCYANREDFIQEISAFLNK